MLNNIWILLIKFMLQDYLIFNPTLKNYKIIINRYKNKYYIYKKNVIHLKINFMNKLII